MSEKSGLPRQRNGKSVTIKSYASAVKPTWCPGCGDYGIMTAIKTALVSLNIASHQALIVTGIGCGSKTPDYMSVNGFLSIHGRPLPVATGAKLANHALTVLVVDGDGDAYGIGGNHLIHTMRRNLDITHIVQNNQVYALTKGQYSPTSAHGTITTTSPDGVIEVPLRPLLLGLTMGATFLARGFAGEPRHLADILIAAIRHRGYALVDVLQPCVTFNKVNTYDWYREHTYKVEQDGHDPTDFEAAFRRCREWEDRIPLGILYRKEGTPTYEDQVPALRQGPLVNQPLDRRAHDFEALKNKFT